MVPTIFNLSILKTLSISSNVILALVKASFVTAEIASTWFLEAISGI